MNLTNAYLARNNINWIENNIRFSDWRLTEPINFIPTEQQRRVLNDASKKILVVGGRSIGKTSLVIADSIANVIRRPKTKCLIIVPTQSSISFVSRKMQSCLNASNLMDTVYMIRNNSREIYFTNDSSIYITTYYREINFKSYDYVYIDEVFYVISSNQDALSYISAMTNDTKIIAVGTPLSTTIREDCHGAFSIHHAPSTKSEIVDVNMIENIRGLYSDTHFMTEILASVI